MIPLPMLPTRALVIVAGVLIVAAAVVVGARGVYSDGFEAGQLHERQAAREAADARQREDQRLASQLAATARAEAAGWRDNAQRLQQENRRARTLVAAAAACGTGPAAGAAGGDGVAGPGLRAPQAPAAGAGDAQFPHRLPGEPELQLSADAVRLWNSALAGRPVPAGACGTAGAPDDACAAATGLTVEDAWANHIENAARSGADRARHQRLIEFLLARQGMPAATTANN